jgi:molybdenum cofactor biosynthesis protein B
MGLLEAHGHRVVDRRIAPDDPAVLTGTIREWCADPSLRLIITTGGTGIARRDATYEALRGLFHRDLPGFGELFRRLSFDEIGAAAMLTRATAGTIDRTALFLLPGSEHAVRLAMTRLILPQIGHLLRELSK